MSYIWTRPDSGFGDFAAWYDTLTFDRHGMAEWARRQDPSLPADDNELLSRIAQPPELGGGFVAGGVRMCLSNRPGGQTEPMRAADQPCPPGSGGVPGAQVREKTAEEIRRELEEQKAREAAEAVRAPETVTVTGAVQKLGVQTLTSVTISSGMTGRTHPTFGSEPRGEPLRDLTVAVDGQSARTDAKGRFTISAQAPGLVSGVVKDRVGKGKEAVLVVIGKGSSVTDSSGRFRIPLHVAEIRGRVVDGFGRAVGGTTVEIEADPTYRSGRFDARGWYDIPYSVQSSSYVAAVVPTDVAGNFSVKVPTGSYTVKIRAEGFAERRVGGISLRIGAVEDLGDVLIIPPLGTRLVSAGDQLPRDGKSKEEQEESNAVTAWYKSTWFWVGVAAVTVGGVGYLIWRQREGR